MSISFYLLSVLIFAYVLLIREGQTGETLRPSKKEMPFRKSGVLDRKLPQLCAMSPEVSRQPVAAEGQIRSQADSVRYVTDKVTKGEVSPSQRHLFSV